MNAYNVELARRGIQIFANVLVLAAVAVGMYQASFFPDETLSVFCKWFFSLLAGILLLTWLAVRLLRRLWPVDAAQDLAHCSVVDLPGKGARLVRWKVLSPPPERARR